MPTSRNCCCITATIKRVLSVVEVFMVMWKRTPLDAGSQPRRAGFGLFRDRDRSGNVSVVGPALRREYAARRCRPTLPRDIGSWAAVDGVGDGLADTHILQYRIAQVEAEILYFGAGGVFDGEKGFALQGVHGVGRQKV